MDLEGLGLLPQSMSPKSHVLETGSLMRQGVLSRSTLPSQVPIRRLDRSNLIFVVILEEVGSPHQTQNLLEW